MQQIKTPRLYLVQSTISLLEKLLEGDQVLSAFTGWNIVHPWNEFGRSPFRHALDQLRANEADAHWWNYLIVHRKANQLIGSCGYKGPPDFEGRVEIGYEITQTFRNRGLATETAKALVKCAFEHHSVQLIQAHTLAPDNASARVLTKVGMQLDGPVEIATHGRLWKWIITPTD